MSDGNGNYNPGGMLGWMGGPGQREIVRRSESDEIGADDARGRRVVLLNILLVLLAILGIILTGAVTVVIIASALLLLVFITLQADTQTQQVIKLVFCGACMGLWFWLLDIWLWDRISEWWPIPVYIPWWIWFILESILIAAMFGLRDLREAHRRSLFNRNWPPLFTQMPWNVGPYYDNWPFPGDVPEPEQIITEREVPRPIPMLGQNGNNTESPKSATEPRLDAPEKFKSPTGVTCLWRELVEFIWTGLEIGITTSTWNKRKGWGKPYISALQKTLQQHGIAMSRGEGSPFNLTIKTKAEAAVAIDMLHRGLYPEQYPPTPPCAPAVHDENTLDMDGQTVDGQTDS